MSRNGVGSSAPFCTMRMRPGCSTTNSRVSLAGAVRWTGDCSPSTTSCRRMLGLPRGRAAVGGAAAGAGGGHHQQGERDARGHDASGRGSDGTVRRRRRAGRLPAGRARRSRGARARAPARRTASRPGSRGRRWPRWARCPPAPGSPPRAASPPRSRPPTPRRTSPPPPTVRCATSLAGFRGVREVATDRRSGQVCWMVASNPRGCVKRMIAIRGDARRGLVLPSWVSIRPRNAPTLICRRGGVWRNEGTTAVGEDAARMALVRPFPVA